MLRVLGWTQQLLGVVLLQGVAPLMLPVSVSCTLLLTFSPIWSAVLCPLLVLLYPSVRVPLPSIPRPGSRLHQTEAAADAAAKRLLVIQLRVRLVQVTLQFVRADELPFASAAQVEEGVFPDMCSQGGHLRRRVVTQQAGEGALGPVDQHVALALQLVFESPVAGGAVVEELPEALTGLQPTRGMRRGQRWRTATGGARRWTYLSC